jgi:pyroglutamyl-peptidase
VIRRRHKTPKREKAQVQTHATPAPKPSAASPAPARSRRRARSDVTIPPELIVPPQTRASLANSEPATVPAARSPQPFVPKPQPPAPKQQIHEKATHSPAAKASPPRAASKSEAVVLVTGFEPFAGERSNPSWEVCTRLPSAIAGLRVEVLKVPCEFRRSIEVTAAAIERHHPSLVVCVGQAGGRAHMSVERVAINVDDGRIADNAGTKPVDEPIAAGGPSAYFATLPIKAMVAEMRAMGVPAEVSNSAGTYVCNHLMYGVLHFLAASGNGARAGFIHVPYSEEQVLDKPGVPSMALATMARGVEAAIEAAFANARDLKVEGGALD